MALPLTPPLSESLRRVAACRYRELICYHAEHNAMRCFHIAPGEGPWTPVGAVGGGGDSLEIVWGSSTQFGISIPMEPPTPEELAAADPSPAFRRRLDPDLFSPGPQLGRRAKDPQQLAEARAEETGGALFTLSFHEDRFHIGPASYGESNLPPRGALIAYLSLSLGAAGASFTEIHSCASPENALPSLLADDALLYSSDQNHQAGLTRAMELWRAIESLSLARELDACSRPGLPPQKKGPRI